MQIHKGELEQKEKNVSSPAGMARKDSEKNDNTEHDTQCVGPWVSS